jgi:hypothetical protein
MKPKTLDTRTKRLQAQVREQKLSNELMQSYQEIQALQKELDSLEKARDQRRDQAC